MAKISNNLFKAPINNAVLDPMQGFDADVYVLDQATGSYTMIGRFVSIQITIRNSTEPYLEFNQRVPRYLDGEFQIGWVLERGMLDYRALEHTFGLATISRSARLNRGTRFQISFSLNAEELQSSSLPDGTGGGGRNGNGAGVNAPNFGSGIQTGNAANRKTQGKLRLTFCKVDSYTLGSTAGRSVIANRWEGVAEGIEEINSNVLGAGTYLESVGGLAALTAGANSDKTINPFPWDLAGVTEVQNSAGNTTVNIAAQGNDGLDFFE